MNRCTQPDRRSLHPRRSLMGPRENTRDERAPGTPRRGARARPAAARRVRLRECTLCGSSRPDVAPRPVHRSAVSPRRRASPGPPTGQAQFSAGVTLRRSPEPIRDDANGSRVRLRVFEERRRRPRFTGSTSGADEAIPAAAARKLLSYSVRFLEAPGSGKTSRATSAKGGTPALVSRIDRPPPSTTASHADHAAWIRPTRAEPRFSSCRDLPRTTSPYSSNRNRSIGFFI